MPAGSAAATYDYYTKVQTVLTNFLEVWVQEISCTPAKIGSSMTWYATTQAKRHELFMTTLDRLPDSMHDTFLLSFRSLPDPNSNTFSWWKSSLWQAHHADIRMPPSHKCLGVPATNSEIQLHHKSPQNITITYRPGHRIWVYVIRRARWQFGSRSSTGDTLNFCTF